MCQVGILNPKEISLIMSGNRAVPDIKIIKARMDKSPSELYNTQVKPIAY